MVAMLQSKAYKFVICVSPLPYTQSPLILQYYFLCLQHNIFLARLRLETLQELQCKTEILGALVNVLQVNKRFSNGTAGMAY